MGRQVNQSRYNQVRLIQVNHLASARFGVSEEITKNLCDKIDEKVDAYSAGDLKHAVDAMSLLWEVSKKSKRPSPNTLSPSISVSPAPLLPSRH